MPNSEKGLSGLFEDIEMGIKQTVVVLGVKCFKGDVKNDRSGETNHYDSTTLFVAMKMPATDTTAGAVLVELKWGDSQNFKKLRDLAFPLQVELDTEQEANSKGVIKTVVLDCKPLPSPTLKTA